MCSLGIANNSECHRSSDISYGKFSQKHTHTHVTCTTETSIVQFEWVLVIIVRPSNNLNTLLSFSLSTSFSLSLFLDIKWVNQRIFMYDEYGTQPQSEHRNRRHKDVCVCFVSRECAHITRVWQIKMINHCRLLVVHLSLAHCKLMCLYNLFYNRIPLFQLPTKRTAKIFCIKVVDNSNGQPSNADERRQMLYIVSDNWRRDEKLYGNETIISLLCASFRRCEATGRWRWRTTSHRYNWNEKIIARFGWAGAIFGVRRAIFPIECVCDERWRWIANADERNRKHDYAVSAAIFVLICFRFSCLAAIDNSIFLLPISALPFRNATQLTGTGSTTMDKKK